MKERGLNFFCQWKIYFIYLRIDLENVFLAHYQFMHLEI